MTKKQSTIKSQDVLLLLKLLVAPENMARISDIAHDLGISGSEISHGLSRLVEARLLSSDKRTPLRANAYEFIVHGLKYAFPGKLSGLSRGIPTAHSAPPFAGKVKTDDLEQYVWPHEEGTARGQSVVPLYGSVPGAALKDAKLYELLALVDALRIGRVREQQIAEKQIHQAIFSKST